MTCRMDPGVHTVSADEPVGLTVYGYYMCVFLLKKKVKDVIQAF